MPSQLTEESIIDVYRACLNRDPEPGMVQQWLDRGSNLAGLIKGAIESKEFGERTRLKFGLGEGRAGVAPGYDGNNGHWYNTPQQLKVTKTPIDRVLLVGECLFETWPYLIKRIGFDVNMDHVLLTLRPTDQLPFPVERYSFQIASVAFRSLIPDVEYFRWIRLGFSDPAEAERLFENAVRRLKLYVESATRWRNRFPVFVMNFPRFQHNLNGRLLRTYDFRDNLFFVDQLNKHLGEMLQKLDNVYLLDSDNILSVTGRCYVQDDMVTISNHGAPLRNRDDEEDSRRIVKASRAKEHYPINEPSFVAAMWLEAEAMYRSLLQIDAVKMVCVDLDDTMWRGVLSEESEVDVGTAVEGWPIGVAEALMTLKRRGIILAIVSKNTESRIREIFPKVFDERITLDDFAIIKVNWEPKAKNIAQAMKEANLLPRSVVFLDDNPVERESVKAAFPDLRVIEASHYYWKRILLWSPETQVPTITNESSRRSEMIKNQIERENLRETMSREEFLEGLKVSARLFCVQPGSKAFDRALELVNKTNQFNTTGKRWSRVEFETVCRNGAIVAADVSDRLAGYGLVLVGIISGNSIEQIVMSCRVISLDVELAAVSAITAQILRQYPVAVAKSVDTDANLLSRDLFSRAGWSEVDGEWQTKACNQGPAHVTVLDEIVTVPTILPAVSLDRVPENTLSLAT